MNGIQRCERNWNASILLVMDETPRLQITDHQIKFSTYIDWQPPDP